MTRRTREVSGVPARSLAAILASGETRNRSEEDVVVALAESATDSDDLETRIAWVGIREDARRAGITGSDAVIGAWADRQFEEFKQTTAYKRHDRGYQARRAMEQERQAEARDCGCAACAIYLAHTSDALLLLSYDKRVCDCSLCQAASPVSTLGCMRMSTDQLLAASGEFLAEINADTCTCEERNADSCGCTDPECECVDCGQCLHPHGIGDDGLRMM